MNSAGDHVGALFLGDVSVGMQGFGLVTAEGKFICFGYGGGKFKMCFFCGIEIDGVCFRSPLKFLRPIPPYMGATTNFPSFYVVDSVNDPQPYVSLGSSR